MAGSNAPPRPGAPSLQTDGRRSAPSSPTGAVAGVAAASPLGVALLVAGVIGDLAPGQTQHPARQHLRQTTFPGRLRPLHPAQARPPTFATNCSSHTGTASTAGSTAGISSMVVSLISVSLIIGSADDRTLPPSPGHPPHSPLTTCHLPPATCHRPTGPPAHRPPATGHRPPVTSLRHTPKPSPGAHPLTVRGVGQRPSTGRHGAPGIHAES